jgi:hypothetical protein
MARDGTQNLIPVTMRSKEEQKELQRKGGIKSGEARRLKKTLKDTMQMILDLKVTDPYDKQVMDLCKIKKVDQTNQTKLLMALFTRAVTNGKLEDFEKIQEILGQKPNNQQEITVSVDSNTMQTTNSFLSAVQTRKNGFDENE